MLDGCLCLCITLTVRADVGKGKMRNVTMTRQFNEGGGIEGHRWMHSDDFFFITHFMFGLGAKNSEATP